MNAVLDNVPFFCHFTTLNMYLRSLVMDCSKEDTLLLKYQA